MALYILGFLAALFSAMALKLLIKTKERSYLIMELPTYRKPRWANVAFTILEKTKAFVFEAGKIILAISIVLWVLASYGPGQTMNHAEQIILSETSSQNLSEQEIQSALKWNHSYKMKSKISKKKVRFEDLNIQKLKTVESLNNFSIRYNIKLNN